MPSCIAPPIPRAQIIDTAEGITAYQIITLRAALRLYMTTGQKANTAYTPKNMMATASRLTGKKFKPRDYAGAIYALSELIDGPANDQ